VNIGHFAQFGDDKTKKNLSGIIADLFSEQLEQWPQLKTAYEALRQTRERGIACNGFTVRLHFNPLRAKSTTAKIDNKSIAARPCFLCSDNLPEEQRGILYLNKYRILCNPMPAFKYHVTVAAVEHCPQSIEGNSETLFRLIDDLGSGWTVLYNGPKCGASAPDHNHFQAIPSGLLPIEDELRSFGPSGLNVFTTDNPRSVDGLGRSVILLKGNDRGVLQTSFENALKLLKRRTSSETEPMINVAGRKYGDEFNVFVFPRSKHRAESYYLTGDEKITVSPAVIEMCGVIVTPVERDFERLTAKEVQEIYREVSLRTVSALS
jgi:hypothetical protein